MFIFLIVFLILLIYGMKYEYDWIAIPFEQNRMVALRGICAVEIVIGHIGVASDSPWLFLNRKAGILIVGLFFFLSGYGLVYSMNHKENYMDSFLRIRVSRVLFPAIFVYLLYYIVDICFLSAESISALTIQYFTMQKLSEKVNWYVPELMLLYFVFWLLYKKLSFKTATIIMWIFCLFFVVGMWVIGIGNPWYGSTLCFPMGILFAKYEKGFIAKIKEKYILCIVTGVLAMGMGIFLFFFMSEYSFLANVFGRNLASLAFVMTVAALLLKMRIGNKVTQFIGMMSYELFLVHEIFVFQEMFKSNLIWNICAILFSLLFAYLLYHVDKKLIYSR